MASRSLPAFTFALNYAWGDLQPGGYHLVNIALHILCALVAFIVLARTSKRLDHVLGDERTHALLAFVIALLWMVHPLNSECVNYLTQRTESLMGLCYLLALYCASKVFAGGSTGWSIGAMLCCALGMASKETMVSAPLAIWLYECTFTPISFVGALARRPWFYGGLASTWAVLAWGLWAVPHGATIGLYLRVSPWTYALNQAEMIGIYLALSAWPHPLVLDYGFVRDLGLVDVWVQVIGVLLLVQRLRKYLPSFPVDLGERTPGCINPERIYANSALVLLVVLALRRWPAWGFVGAWFFLLLGPTSSFIPILTEVGAERRMYLPLLSVVVLFVLAGYKTLIYIEDKRSMGFRQRHVFGLGGVMALGIAVVLGWITSERNRDYSSAVRIWETAVEARPKNARAHLNLGAAYERKGSAQVGLFHYRQALAISPHYAEAHGNLGALLGVLGQYELAIDHLRQAVAQRPKNAGMHTNLGTALAAQGHTQEAAGHYRRALEIDPNFSHAHYNWANLHANRQEYDKAASHYRHALEIDPDNEEARQNLKIVLEWARDN